MERKTIIIIISVVVILLFITLIAITIKIWSRSDDITTGLSLYHCPSYSGGKIMENVYNQLGFKQTRNVGANIYLPCGYTWVEKELRDYKPRNGQIILAIDGCDQIVAKNGLWKVLSEKYGREYASQLVPRSYVTSSTNDMNLLKQEYDSHKIYIMKKNVQRQQGLKLTKNLSEMQQARSNGYVIIQEYLMTPLLFDKRKFDIRIYLLVLQKGAKKEFYRHSGGRCHYTSQDFRTNDLERSIHIPSGYSEDHEFKDTHPETLKDLRDYMNKNSGSGDYFFDRLDEMLRECCVAFSNVLGKDRKYVDKKTVHCQLFGLDVLSDQNLRPVLIEINKGPEMAWSSEPEYQYKQKLTLDMFELLGYTQKTNDQLTPNEFNLLIKT